MKIIQNGYKLTADFKTFPTQFSENVEVKFIRDKKYASSFIQPFIAYGSNRINVLAPKILEDDTIVFPKEVFVQRGEIVLSISIMENNKIENTEIIAIKVMSSAGLENVLPKNEDTWKTVLSNYLMQELKLNINPRIETIVKEAEDLQAATSDLQTEIALLIESANERITYLINNVNAMVENGDFDGNTINNGEGIPNENLGKTNDIYINTLSEGEFAQFLFIKLNNIWIPQFKVAGKDGKDGIGDSVPLQGSILLPEDISKPNGYEFSDNYYLPIEIIGINESTPLQSLLSQTEQRIKALEDNGVAVGDTLPIGSIVFVDGSEEIDGYEDVDIIPPKQLLINNDFQINQRDKTIYNNGGYTLDMWKTTQSLNTLTVNDGYITLENKSDVNTCAIIQINSEFDVTKEYTLTVKFKDDDNIYSITTKAGETKDVEILEGINLQFYYNTKRVSLTLKPLKKMNIEYMDCFEGNIAYPHIKEDYSMALLRCQRYIKAYSQSCPIKYEYANSTTYYYLIKCFIDEMKAQPTVTDIYYQYIDTASVSSNSRIATITGIYKRSFLLKTDPLPRMHDKCRAVDIDFIVTCEPV